MAEYKKATKAELAKQFVKEVAAGSFSKKGAASRAGQVISKRSRTGGEETFDANTYRDRQTTDSNN